MKTKPILYITLLWQLFASSANAQDSLAVKSYSNNYVWYTDLGFNTAPIGIKIPENQGIDKLNLRNNSKMMLGIGFSYKWFSLRLSTGVLGNLRPLSQYGKTTYYDLGFDFTFKKRFFFDFDFHSYQGYTYKNAYQWNDTINGINKNLYLKDVGGASFSLNTWHFFNHHFKMQAFRGKTANYTKDIKTVYFRYTFNIHGMANNTGRIIPNELIDSSDSKTLMTGLMGVDFGLIPGYAYVRRWNQFQFGGMAGLGGVIQFKGYATPDIGTRAYLGLAPRLDVKIMGGINKPRHFVMLIADFDAKSIRFRDFAYRQTFYSMKLVAGIRLDKKKKK